MKPFRVLGTTYWRSYALDLAGRRKEAEGDLETAEQLYLQALEADRGNRSARLSFATLLYRTAPGERDAAIEHLKQVGTESKADGTPLRETIYYFSRYQLASVLFDAELGTEALEEARLLSHDVDRGLEEIKKRVSKRRGALRIRPTDSTPEDRALMTYLQSIQPAVTVMLIGMRIASGDHSAAGLLDQVDVSIPEASFQYDLACTYSILEEKVGSGGEFADMAVKHLAFALRLYPGSYARVPNDLSLKRVREIRQERVGEIIATARKAAEARAAKAPPPPPPPPLAAPPPTGTVGTAPAAPHA